MSTAPLGFETLPFQERLLIWSLRMSYTPNISDADTLRALEHAFRFANIELALPSFNGYANTIATCLMDHQLTVNMHCPPCPGLGRDEWHMVQAVAALQVRDRHLAGEYLNALLPPAAVRICCGFGAELARMLSRLNFRLRTPSPPTPFVPIDCRHDMTELSFANPVLH